MINGQPAAACVRGSVGGRGYPEPLMVWEGQGIILVSGHKAGDKHWQNRMWQQNIQIAFINGLKIITLNHTDF